MTKITDIYCDLDNVAADFEGHYRFLTGFDWHDTPEEGTSWDRLNKAMRPDFFLNMPAMPKAKEYIAVFRLWTAQIGATFAYLTALPIKTSYPTWKDEKIQWGATGPLQTPDVPVIVTDRAQDKQQFAHPGAVLIDDNPLNIEQWTSKGGIGILHTSWDNTFFQLRQHIAQTIAHRE